MKLLLQWTTIIPALAWVLFFSGLVYDNTIFQVTIALVSLISIVVMTAGH